MKKFFQLLTVAALLPAVSYAQITVQAADVKLVDVFAIQSVDTTLDQTIV
ncbi:MAG: hypothetical protein IT258_01980, partial [Saprospiraceae bacterium]|nr:hypothetical protein [Saprospiraceae bacterium]